MSVSRRDPMTIDPALVERGTKGHATAQNLIADAARRAGHHPRSPAPGEPNYDVAWQVGSDYVVVEVKSITDENEERQLRLGLGQVLRYRSLLGRGGQIVVRGVLMAERAPSDPSWRELCSDLGIELFWPERLTEL